MNTITITLPESLSDFVAEEATAQGYSNTVEYIQDVLKAEQRKKAREKLTALVMEGINSGPATPMTAEDWEGIHQRVQQRLAGGT